MLIINLVKKTQEKQKPKKSSKTQQKRIFQTNNHLIAFDINYLNIDVLLQVLVVLKIAQQIGRKWKFKFEFL